MNSVSKWIGGNFADTCGHINVGVKEIFSKEEILLFPNPCTEYLNIEFSQSDISFTEIEIVNVLGERVYYSGIKNNKAFQVNTQNFSKGIYFARLLSVDLILVRKVLKQ
ncbi:MAG TPA: T9SS type A sorting domain-containing protein [Bacteroidia bacterium]|jgi:hypothetical protein